MGKYTIPVNLLNSNLEILECSSEIINWLHRNDLLVNTSKTELFNVSRVYINFLPVIIDGRVIHIYSSVCNIELSSIVHYLLMVTFVLSANFHLCRIGHIRKYCSNNINKLLINVLVLFIIYYCESLITDLRNMEVNNIDRIIRASMHYL